MGGKKGPRRSPPSTVDEKVLSMVKLEDWDVGLGDLWDCGKSAPLPDSLFVGGDKLIVGDHLQVIPIPETTYTLSRVRDASGKAFLLDMSLEVKLRIPAGTNVINVEGGINFAKEEVKKSDQEEFFCQYEATTATVRVRSSVTEDPAAVNHDVVTKIESGTLAATHYVSEIQYGGVGTAKFSLSDKLEHDRLEFGGHIGGTIPVFAGIDVGIKASLDFMEKKHSAQFTKKMEVSYRPGLSDPVLPSTFEEMFTLVEKMPEGIQEAKLPYDEFPGVKGVPMTFKLSPLSHLNIKRPGDSVPQKALSNAILESAVEALFALSELDPDLLVDKNGDPHFSKLRTLLREENHVLPLLFIPASEKVVTGQYNPFADKVFGVEHQLFPVAKTHKDKIERLIKLFSDQDEEEGITEEDVMKAIEEYKRSIVGPAKLRQTALTLAEEGRRILAPLKLSDATVAGDEGLFVLNPHDWYIALRVDPPGPKLFFSTGGGAIPPFSLMTLYRMRPTLGSDTLGNILVRVSASNIVESCKLELMTEKEDHEFVGEEMLLALDFFKDIVASAERKHSMASRFQEAWNADGSRLPSWDFLGDFQTYFATVQRDRKGKVICESYLQTADALAGEDASFVLTPQFTPSLRTAVMGFKRLERRVGTQGASVVVASFDGVSEFAAGPRLMVLRKGGGLVEKVVIDNLDFLLLIHATKTGDTKIGDFLSPRFLSKYPLFPNEQGETTGDLITILEGRPFTARFRPSPFEMAGQEGGLQWREAMNVVTAACFARREAFVHSVAKPVVGLAGGPIVSLLKKEGWTLDTGFASELSSDKWTSLKAGVERYHLELKTPIEEEDPEADEGPKPEDQIFIYLDALKEALGFAAGELSSSLQSVCGFFINRFIESSPHIDPGESSGLAGRLMVRLGSVTNHSVTGLLSLLEMLSIGHLSPNYFQLWKAIDELDVGLEATSKRNLDPILTALSKCTHKEKEWVWSNPKFRAYISLFHQSKSILTTIFKLYCSPPKPSRDFDTLIESIPTYFPEELTQVLIPLAMMGAEPYVEWEWEEGWEDVEEMRDAFHTLIVKGSVPHDFTNSLLKNLKDREDLKGALRDKGVLFFWRQGEALFEAAWGMGEIQKAWDAFEEDLAVQLEKGTVNEAVQGQGLLSDRSHDKVMRKLRDDVWLDVEDERWRLITGPQMKALSTQDFFQVPLVNWAQAPLILTSGAALETSWNESLFRYILSQLRQGQGWVVNQPEHSLHYIDYPYLSLTLPPLEWWREVPDIGPFGYQTSSWMGHLASYLSPIQATIFSPGLSMSCIRTGGGGRYAALSDDGSASSTDDTVGPKDFMESPFLVSASDITVGILTASLPLGHLVTSELLQALARPHLNEAIDSIVALPWKIPDILSSSPETDLTGALRMVHLRDGSTSVRVFQPPFKLITALRLGNRPFPFGKSSLLNAALLRTFQFSARREPGHLNGAPLRRDGLLEVTWLTKGSVTKSFYDGVLESYVSGKYRREPVFLANLHGDALGQLEKIPKNSGALLIFWSIHTIQEFHTLMEEVSSVFGAEVEIVHIFLHPSEELSKVIPKESVVRLEKDFDIEGRIHSVFASLLMNCGTSFEHEKEESSGLFEVIKNNSVHSVKRALVTEVDPDLRTLLLSELVKILQTPNEEDVLKDLWHFSILLKGLAEETSASSKAILEGVTKNLVSYSDERGATAAAGLAAESLVFKQLTIHDLLKALTSFVTSPSVYANLVFPLLKAGCPFEILPLSEHVEALLSSSNLKFLTLSTLGFYGCGKREVLDNIFMTPNFLRVPNSLPGVAMQVLLFDQATKDAFRGVYDALLLLDVEEFGRPETLLRDGNAVAREAQLTSFLLSVSDLVLFFTGGAVEGVIWKERLLAIIGQHGLYSSVTPTTRVAEADLMFVTRGKQSDLGEDILGLLKSLSTGFLAERNVVRLMARNFLYDALTSTYHRIFADSIKLQVDVEDAQTIRGSILQTLQRRVLFPSTTSTLKSLEEGTWFDEVRQMWETVETHWTSPEHFPFLKAMQEVEEEKAEEEHDDDDEEEEVNPGVPEEPEAPEEEEEEEDAKRRRRQTKEARETGPDLIRKAEIRDELMGHIESALEAHEGILVDARKEVWTSDFSSMNGVPYFCIYSQDAEGGPNCECVFSEVQIQSRIEELNLAVPSIAERQLMLQDFELYGVQVWADCLTHLEQEGATMEITYPVWEGALNAALKEMIKEGLDGAQLLLEFKRLVASKVGVTPWPDVMRAELKDIYGEDMVINVTRTLASFEQLTFTSFNHALRWGLAPPDFLPRKAKMQGLLTWEEALWLEMEVEKAVLVNIGMSEGRYRRGNVRRFRDHVNGILTKTLRKRLPSQLSFLPSFYVQVHTLAVASFVEAWLAEWEAYEEKWNPLKAFEEREGLFPDQIFDPDYE